MTVEHSFCRICEQLCGLDVEVEKDQIVKVRPDRSHVVTTGHVCIKGTRQHLLYNSPDRLLYPQKRTGDTWEDISWGQAMKEIGEKIRRLKKEDGPESVALYVGTAAGFSILHPIFAQGFMMGLGSKSQYAPHTQDCANKFVAAREVYGYPLVQPMPDVDHTSCFIVVGANPAMSKFSFMQLSHPLRRIADIEKRGGRVFWIDPRKTESARSSGTHVFINPNTDVFFYLSFLREVISGYRLDRERIERYMSNFDLLEPVVSPWSPEKTEEVTGIPAETLREMVRVYMESDGAALYSSTGVNMGTHGTLSFWLQEVINAVSGNLDRRGGTLVGKGVVDFPAFGKKNGSLMSRERSRIGNYPAVMDCFAGGILPDEITTPGPGQVKALFVTGGNPVLTMANGNRVREAFKELELLVTLDIYRNETGSLAHYILPTTDPYQRPDIPFMFPLMIGMQSRPYLQATRAMVPPRGEQLDEMEIYIRLSRACGAPQFGSRILQKILEAGQKLHRMGPPFSWFGLGQKRMLSILLRLGGQGSFKKLLTEPHGRLLESPGAGTFLGKRVLTESGRLDLAPASFLEAAGRLDADFRLEQEKNRGLRLISKREIRTHNSWTHNIDEFIEGERKTNYLYMHPMDAADRLINEGDYVDVTSGTGKVRVPVRYLTTLKRGVVALPHGWGHQHATGLSVASKAEGVNVNVLVADGVGNLEELSGMANLTGFSVDVRPASGPPQKENWSGVPEKIRAGSVTG